MNFHKTYGKVKIDGAANKTVRQALASAVLKKEEETADALTGFDVSFPPLSSKSRAGKTFTVGAVAFERKEPVFQHVANEFIDDNALPPMNVKSDNRYMQEKCSEQDSEKSRPGQRICPIDGNNALARFDGTSFPNQFIETNVVTTTLNRSSIQNEWKKRLTTKKITSKANAWNAKPRPASASKRTKHTNKIAALTQMLFNVSLDESRTSEWKIVTKKTRCTPNLPVSSILVSKDGPLQQTMAIPRISYINALQSKSISLSTATSLRIVRNPTTSESRLGRTFVNEPIWQRSQSDADIAARVSNDLESRLEAFGAPRRFSLAKKLEKVKTILPRNLVGRIDQLRLCRNHVIHRNCTFPSKGLTKDVYMSLYVGVRDDLETLWQKRQRRGWGMK